jgi:PHP family Zn ribbon phosphoesterase
VKPQKAFLKTDVERRSETVGERRGGESHIGQGGGGIKGKINWEGKVDWKNEMRIVILRASKLIFSCY